MIRWFKELDELLRGRKTTAELLTQGVEHIHLRPLAYASILLGITYGVFMGLYAVLTRTPPCYPQLVATALKVPALFFLTLVITFPSLYVFSALLGVRLGSLDTLRVIVAPIAINLAVLASFGPITGFFTLSTTSYHFVKLLNVLFFAIAGVIGLGFLLRMLLRIETVQQTNTPTIEEHEPVETLGPGNRNQPVPWPLLVSKFRAFYVFLIWVVLYSLVGAQMGWVLRPFIGAPNLPFQLFRPRQANILIDVFNTIGQLLAGG